MHNYKELKVWTKAVELSTAVYAICSKLPSEEKFGLKSQMQRSGVSIASNIAEGAGRSGNKEFAHFLSVAVGSCYELETQLIIIEELLLISKEHVQSMIEQINKEQKMINNLIGKLRVNSKQLIAE